MVVRRTAPPADAGACPVVPSSAWLKGTGILGRVMGLVTGTDTFSGVENLLRTAVRGGEKASASARGPVVLQLYMSACLKKGVFSRQWSGQILMISRPQKQSMPT